MVDSVVSAWTMIGIFLVMFVCVIKFHEKNKNLEIATAGMIIIFAYKKTFVGFDVIEHFHHESNILLNVCLLLFGFKILADYFERSNVPLILPKFLPNDWKGGFVLLCIVFTISIFLDNIASAMIGATIANVVFVGQVGIPFFVGIVLAANAGGAGSIIGDTTTTMLWIAGKSPVELLKAYVAAVPCFVFCAYFAAKSQDKLQQIVADAPADIKIKRSYLFVVLAMLGGTIAANYYFDFPAVGLWAVILLSSLVFKPDWKQVFDMKGSKDVGFVMALMVTASLLDLSIMPKPSPALTLGSMFASGIIDNIPLTKAAIAVGGFVWSLVAYANGVGGTITWFGSSTGVAIAEKFPQIKNPIKWLKEGWFVVPGMLIGFACYMLVFGWHPSP